MMGETQTVSDVTACGTGGQCDDGRCFLAFPRYQLLPVWKRLGRRR